MTTEQVTTIDPSLTLSLQQQDLLGKEKHAYRLAKIGKDVLIYGADDGLLVRAQDQKTVRRWEDDALRAVAISSDQRTIAVGVDTGEVEIYEFAEHQASNTTAHPFCAPVQNAAADEDDAFLSQSDELTSPWPSDKMRKGPRGDSSVRDLLFLNNSYLAIATESGMVVVDLSQEDMPTYLDEQAKKEHNGGGIRGLAWNSRDSILTSLAMDGKVCYWTCPLTSDPESWKLWRKEPHLKILKKDVGEVLGADVWDRSSRPCQSGPHLAIPGSNLWQLVKWTANPLDYKQLFQTDTIHSKTTVVVRSLGAQWLTTDRNGEIVLWQLESESMKEKHRLNGQLTDEGLAPTDAIWTKEKLWIATADGRILVWDKDVLPQAVASLQDRPMITEEDDEKEIEEPEKTKETTTAPESGPTEKAPSRKRLQKAGESGENDDNDDDDDDVDFSQPPPNPFVEDQAIEDNEDQDEIQPIVHDNQSADVNGQAGDEMDDDEDDDENSFDMDQFAAPTSRSAPTWAPPAVQPQAAFGPSSTPLEDPRRFLCWNQVGALSIRETDPGRSAVDIDFTDSAFRRPISFTDTIGFILGSLGEDGAILASDIPETDDLEENDIGDVVEGLKISEKTKAALKKDRKKDSSTNGSTIYFHRFETFASNREKDWYLTLPAGERALGCATGEGWAAVMTHRRFLRLFTTGGNQGEVLWIDGEPVTMVGRSRFLAVVYHQSTPLPDGTQKMGYSLYDAIAGRVVTKGSLSCLSSRATLKWLGFSNHSALMAMDSDGMLSMLVSSADASSHWKWMPVLDTMALRKSTDDSHWPVHVSEGRLICVPLKGGKKCPDVARRPITTSIGVRVPLARGQLTNIHAMEELAVRSIATLHQHKAVQHILNPDLDEDEEFEKEFRTMSAQVDKLTLKQFAACIEAGKFERALDLVKQRLNLERSFDLAMKIADRHRTLVDHIEAAKESKFPPEYAEEEDDYVAADSPPEATAGAGAYQSSVTPDAVSGQNPKRAFGWAGDAGRKSRRVS